MLNDRVFQEIIGSEIRKLIMYYILLLAPLLFSIIADMPKATSTKFGYADDWGLTIQTKSIEKAEEILTNT